MLQSEWIVALSRRLSEASQEHQGHCVISDLPVKEGTVLFLEQNLLWWRGSQASIWNYHVWNIHQARNALRWVGCTLISYLRQTQRLSNSYNCLGYAPCQLPKATLTLYRVLLWAPQQEQVEDFSPSSNWWLLALTFTRELPWAEQGKPSQATLLLSDGQLGQVSPSDTVHPLFSTFCSCKRTPFPR